MTPLAAALLFVEGVLLVLVVCDTCSDESRRFAAVRMLVLGCTAAAALNLLRIVTAAFAQEHSWSAFLGYFARLRVNIHHGDWNAAGSYFAMVLVVAAALAVRSRAYAAAVPIIAAAVWMSGSRFALAACLATATGLGIIALVRPLTAARGLHPGPARDRRRARGRGVEVVSVGPQRADRHRILHPVRDGQCRAADDRGAPLVRGRPRVVPAALGAVLVDARELAQQLHPGHGRGSASWA